MEDKEEKDVEEKEVEKREAEMFLGITLAAAALIATGIALAVDNYSPAAFWVFLVVAVGGVIAAIVLLCLSQW